MELAVCPGSTPRAGPITEYPPERTNFLMRMSTDGFPIRRKFAVPPDTIGLDPKIKREVTICNLFSNHKLTVRDIVRVLDEDYRHIVNVLLKNGVAGERRERQDAPPEGIERRILRYDPSAKS
jgi:hypothetical protein